MTRPRLLLVSEFTELEWVIKPLLGEWAEVLSFDPPGIGEEPLPDDVADLGSMSREVLSRHALDKLDAAGWERFFVVSDGWGNANAVSVAARRRVDVAGVALGHAALSYARQGERAPINAEVFDTFTQLIQRDAPSFVRYGIAQVTQGGIDEDLAQRIIERIPAEHMAEGWVRLTSDEPFADDLLALDCPLLLAKHEGCLLSTDEGFEDAVAALPHAETVICDESPAASPAFARALRDFCAKHATE